MSQRRDRTTVKGRGIVASRPEEAGPAECARNVRTTREPAGLLDGGQGQPVGPNKSTDPGPNPVADYAPAGSSVPAGMPPEATRSVRVTRSPTPKAPPEAVDRISAGVDYVPTLRDAEARRGLAVEPPVTRENTTHSPTVTPTT